MGSKSEVLVLTSSFRARILNCILSLPYVFVSVRAPASSSFFRHMFSHTQQQKNGRNVLVLRRGAAVNSITAPLLSVLSETLANWRRRSEDVCTVPVNPLIKVRVTPILKGYPDYETLPSEGVIREQDDRKVFGGGKTVESLRDFTLGITQNALSKFLEDVKKKKGQVGDQDTAKSPP